MFNISWMALLKIMGAGAFSFLLLPLLLVIRDLLLHKAIGKWILTDDLDQLIRLCEHDRWLLNNKYNKKISYTLDYSSHKINNKEVTKEEYNEYVRGQEAHSKRYEYANSKILLKHNLITWLTKHYKLADGGNPIPSLRETYYKLAESHQNDTT
jgi:hypothetical protein